MALINTAADKRIVNPSNEKMWMEVDYVFIIPTIDSETTCIVEVRLSSDRELDNGDMLRHNLGTVEVDGLQDPLLEDKLHAFCIEKLGNSFVKL